MKKFILFWMFYYTTNINSQNTMIDFNYQYDAQITNASGQLHGTLTSTNYDDQIDYQHTYENGSIVKAINYKCKLKTNEPLVGIYQNGKPFEGYFVYQHEIEIPIIAYYVKGVFVEQYSCTLTDLLLQEETYQPIAWKKTSFKNGLPFTGLYHKETEDLDGFHLFVTENFENGKVISAEMWIMAMHYAEMLKVVIDNNGYAIYKDALPEGGDPVIDIKAKSLHVFFEDENKGTVTYKVDDKNVSSFEFTTGKNAQQIAKKQGNLIYSIENDTLKYVQRYNFTNDTTDEAEHYNVNQNTVFGIYSNLINAPSLVFQKAPSVDYVALFQDSTPNYESILYLGEGGKVFRGPIIEKQEQNNYKLTHYLEYIVVKEENNKNLEQIGLLLQNKK